MMLHPAVSAARRKAATFPQRNLSIYPWRASSFRAARSSHSLASSFLLELTSSPATPSSLLFVDPRFQQVRWKRRDGNKAFSKVRPPTRNQRKVYNRKLRAQQERENRHGRHGSKAGERREWIQTVKDNLLNSNDEEDDPSLLEYGVEDALLDDLMGNTKGLTSQPTPRPVYLGHKHEKFDRQLKLQMDSYRREAESIKHDSESALVVVSKFPSDKLISLALRSYRDKNGTRQRPIGIVMALEYLLKEVGLVITAFGELTYTTLLSCCRTPAEGRRILQMMKQEQHPVSAYSYSILVDVASKVGDYKGAADIMEEMLAEGVPPTLAAYTSFLAACYKVCNDGRVAHSIRAEAAKLAFEKWQEMREVGVEPDAMAYGAMLRLCAAQGHPERALNILEEMQQMEVKPTTLCFSSALRAVARSHATAIRYERGASRKNRRREMLTQHHGRLARSIVIMAENAEIEQDDGFIAALMLCAAAGGDAATAKAIYVASQIRRLDQFRTIGSESHLAQLRGEVARQDPLLAETRQLVSSGDLNGNGALVEQRTSELRVGNNRRDRTTYYPSFEEREYGKDSRVLSAILHACAQAVDQNGIGTMWSGRENRGYLCDNSLRLLTARWVPRYTDNSIPGQTRTGALTWDGEHKDEDYRGGKRKPRKFTGVDASENGASNLDELDDMFERIFVDEDGRRKEEFRSTTPEDIWRMKYAEYSEDLQEQNFEELSAQRIQPQTQIAGEERSDTPEEEMFFDYDSMRWKTRLEKEPLTESEVVEKNDLIVIPGQNQGIVNDQQEELVYDSDVMRWKKQNITLKKVHSVVSERIDFRESVIPQTDDKVPPPEEAEEMYFDYDSMRWKTRLKREAQVPYTNYESNVLLRETDDDAQGNDASSHEIDEDEFTAFYSELHAEVSESGDGMESVNEEEARELFLLMKTEYSEVMEMDLEDLVASSVDPGTLPGVEMSRDSIEPDAVFESTIHDIKDSWSELGAMVDVEEDMRPTSSTISAPETRSNLATATLGEATTRVATFTQPPQYFTEEPKDVGIEVISPHMSVFDKKFSETVEVINEEDIEAVDDGLEEMRQLLPAFSEKRLRKILRTFRKSLGDPSLLDLLPIVRERMPDYITATWLKQMATLTARYVMRKADHEEKIDLHILNGVLELETLTGSLDRALNFYETAFRQHKLAPNDYSNRLVLQMFLKNKRLSRALAFTERLKENGEILDIQAYGSLIDYCARHGHVGSSMLLLKECLSVHGSPPGEASLTKLRLLCRKAGLDSGLTGMIGEDPIEWLRYGEAKLKREMSKSGRRNVQLARNRQLRL